MHREISPTIPFILQNNGNLCHNDEAIANNIIDILSKDYIAIYLNRSGQIRIYSHQNGFNENNKPLLYKQN